MVSYYSDTFILSHTNGSFLSFSSSAVVADIINVIFALCFLLSCYSDAYYEPCKRVVVSRFLLLMLLLILTMFSFFHRVFYLLDIFMNYNGSCEVC